MKKMLICLIGIVVLFGLTGCGTNELSGKYIYGEEGDSAYGYYDCDAGAKTCDWYFYLKDFGISETKYAYELSKATDHEEYKDNKEMSNSYLITFKEIDGDTTYKALYDEEKRSIYDPELKITYEK